MCSSLLGRRLRKPSSVDPLGDMLYNAKPDWWSARSPDNLVTLGIEIFECSFTLLA
jgi:hypothetical protein